MKNTLWILILCLFLVIGLFIHFIPHKPSEIDRSNETLTPEIEIPIEDDEEVLEEHQSSNTEQYMEEQTQEDFESTKNEDTDEQNEMTVPSDSSDDNEENEDSAVELPEIP